MTQLTAMMLLFILYVGVPVGIGLLGFWGYKKLTKPKTLSYEAMPKLSHIEEKKLPSDVRSILDDINIKGEKLRTLYGDTNNDGKIDDKDIKTESFVIISKMLDQHIPEIIQDYKSLDMIGDNRHEKVEIGTSGVTGKDALLENLNVINAQFDELLDASYQSNAQKLLVANRYLKSRFANGDLGR